MSDASELFDTVPSSHDDFVFRMEPSFFRSTKFWLLLGTLAIVAAIFGFVASILSRANVIQQQIMTTLPTLFGVGSLLMARSVSRTPREVRVGPQGIQFMQRGELRQLAWSDIGWAHVQPILNTNSRQLIIYDTQGRTAIKLSDALLRFNQLAELVKSKIAAKPDETADRVKLAKARRSSIKTALAAVLFLALSVGSFLMFRNEQREIHLLKTQGINGDAVVEELKIAPNGVTPRLIYKVTSADGRSGTENVEIFRDLWDQLKVGDKVAVKYVPAEPAISELLFGQAPDRQPFREHPNLGYALSGLIGIFSLVAIAAAALAWRGIEIGKNPETGRFGFKKFGS
jgi:hypothetical protein